MKNTKQSLVQSWLGELAQWEKIKKGFSNSGKLKTLSKCSQAQRECYYLGDEYPGIYLTKRELEVAYQLLQGATIKKIARQLAISSRTIESYIKHLKFKLKCRYKKELINALSKIDIIKFIK